MNKKNELKIGIILNYINLGIGNLIPIFYTPIMLSLLGQQEYGLYKLSTSITSYLSLVSMGIGAAVTRYLIKAYTEEGKEAEEKVLGLFTVIFQVIAIISFLIGLFLTFNLELFYGKSLTISELSRMKVIVFLMVCNTALNFSQTSYISVVTAHERFIFLQCMNIISTCIVPILSLGILYLGYAAVGMTVISLATGVLIRFTYYVYVRTKMSIKARFVGMPKHLLKEIWQFSFWIFLSNVVAQLYNATDTVMIGAIPALATTGVAIYNVGNTFNSIVFSLTTGVSNLLAPKVNKMVFQGADNQELTELAIRVGRIQAYIIALLVSGFIAFGRPFIGFYAGSEYAESYWVAVLMMIPNMIPLVQSVFLSIIVAKNKHKFRSIVYLGIAILNVVGTWILMQKMGIVGAALMTGIALVIGQGFIMNWYYMKKIELNIPYFWKKVGIIYIVPIVLCCVAVLSSFWIDYTNIIVFLLGVIIYTVIYCILNWCFMMNAYEKNIICAPIKLMKNKIKKFIK